MNRRKFLAAAAAAPALSVLAQDQARDAPTPAGSAAEELEEVSLSEISRGLDEGRWTSRKLVDLYHARIDAIDRSGPHLNSIIELEPDAQAFAEQLDRERREKHIRGPLHGVPLLIKDNIDVMGKMQTTAGSLALEGWHAPKDAFIAARLRAAGAIVIGKANLSEWANFRGARSVSGWSGRGGQTHNPYALNRNPSGSSSGSGASVAASLCGGAIGTETDGSITSPASVNGIVGLKPTVGLLSRSGIIPVAHSQDTAGPMTRTVRDAAIMLSAMTGVDPDDPATAASAPHIAPDYTKFLDPNGLKGARIGIGRQFYRPSDKINEFLSDCVEVLKQAGAVIVDPVEIPTYGLWRGEEQEVLLYEFKADLNAYLSKLPESFRVRSLADVMAFNEKNKDREQAWFGQELMEQAEAKGPLTEDSYRRARANCVSLTRTAGIDAALEKNKIDAIVSITTGPAWLIDWVSGDSANGGSCSGPPAVAGYPHLTVPAGYFKGLPLGLSFIGTAWSEPTLLKLGYAWEQASKARKKPGYSTGMELQARQS